MSKLFTGAGVALITPFKNDYSIDYDALGQIIENQVAGGMDYLVALGTTGEPPTLSDKEKNDVVRFIIEKSAGRLPVVVGMGGNSTQAVVHNIKSFNLEGASGLLIVTPYYNKPSQEGLYRHFKAVAEESPLPVILYNVPSRTGTNMEAETVIRLAEGSEKIVAVKEASGIMSQLTTIKKYTPEDFTLISGDDVLALPIVSIGGKGIISVIANALPGKLSSLIHNAINKDFEGALKLHLEMIDLFKLIFREGNPGGIKALLHSQGIIENVLRLPLYKVGDETYRLISEALKRMG
ncbi:MAG: 4-hydroxy-tetrahydrodipicolinate synthase [Chlorobi bacterium]|nr:4-hydroxy-tetrahydrodipicolinate synthase [Chlorobiota bacterium]